MHQKDKDKEKVFLKDKTKLPPPFHFGNAPDKLEGEVVPHLGKEYILLFNIVEVKNSRALVTHSDEPVAPAAPTAAPAQIGDHLFTFDFSFSFH